MKVTINMNKVESNELANALKATENLAISCDASVNPTDPMRPDKALKGFTDALSTAGKEQHIFNKMMSLRTTNQSIEFEFNDALVEQILIAYSYCVIGIASLIGPAVRFIKSMVRHITDMDKTVTKLLNKERLGETKVVISDEHGLVYSGNLSSLNDDYDLED